MKEIGLHINEVFEISSNDEFNTLALKIFQNQAKHNKVYKNYLNHLNIDIEKVKQIKEIPFLPIEFFKSHDVILEGLNPEIVFTSSGTTGSVQSRHLVSDLKTYEQSFVKAFEHFFGSAENYCILALLPNYLEREGSSLVYMTEKLIGLSKQSASNFYLHNIDELAKKINSPELQDKKIILLGVTYALLDLAENHKIKHPQLIVMETGGMKGKRKEMIREELHQFLSTQLNVNKIYSEYGMTELLSQAYSVGDGIFKCPPWMKILIRDTNDPLSLLDYNKGGGINIIDLANINSCCFLMTQDLGKVSADGSFEVLGRFDASDIRGCNLLVQ